VKRHSNRAREVSAFCSNGGGPNGLCRVFKQWSEGKVDLQEFTKTLLQFYDPNTYDALFNHKPKKGE